MATQAAYAYDYDYDYSPQRRPREVEVPRPPLRALPGRRAAAQQKSLVGQLARVVLSTGAFCFLFAMAVGVTSITVSNATVQMLLESESITETIGEARSVGLELEVQHSIATNPARVQEAAGALGMVPVGQIDKLDATTILDPTTVETIAQAAAKAEKAKAAKAAKAEKAKKAKAAKAAKATAGGGVTTASSDG
ncbi:MAG: hypothetical protein FWG00_02345 [Coriobacteriia bacterium]|nr:hypothetical protein [Coriobacteriia bacterium]